ncbi:MAG: hypothetical protein AUJ24_00660 [Parcubacteria group bacterium CG1_02_36_42]|uniref:Uncharacterized protein n=1 Tax=Candidatus Nealsonbacteria bacterium CG_4_9_14_0_8_um_filter_35_12 TaxID=1974692 RepID=A0A2M8DMC1_9BACT|nr:MAG: hypothetical protein AUJ24_00660 [Parcubacteria group bacterium CG1_02_36_42]PJB99275.1 MAG: hypothetical protein CO077_02580 [Candidatus Nealsonbacteria bacterium CG_4_9_14_0_8_um_filter_35_12]
MIEAYYVNIKKFLIENQTFGVPGVAPGLLLPQSSGLLLSYTPLDFNSKFEILNPKPFGKLEFKILNLPAP